MLGLPADPPTPPPRSHRNSGLEWLSSYRPRPDSPVLSPLRVDRLGDVRYRHPSGKRSPSSASASSPNFLFTLGERPFWELWPQRKWRRPRRRLTLDEFKRSLLEQWAKSQGLPQTAVGTVLPVEDKRRRLEPKQKHPDLIERADHAANFGSGGVPAPVVRVLRVRSETRTKRILRNLRRAARRYRFLDRLSRSGNSRKKKAVTIQRSKSPTGQGVRNGAPGLSVQADGAAVQGCPVHSGTSTPCTEHCRTSGANAGSNYRRRLSKLENLRARVADQQEEISTLREVVQELRSSLQLSDAQNLALQVLLRKVARAEGQLGQLGQQQNGVAHILLPSSSVSTAATAAAAAAGAPGSSLPRHSRHSFRSRMDDSERQLENLVRELKEMSQVRYPALQQATTGSNSGGGGGGGNSNHQGGGTASSTCSANNVYFPAVNGTDEVDHQHQAVENLEEDLEATAEALGGARTGLKAAEEELWQTSERLRIRTRRRKGKEEDEEEVEEAHRALERAMRELNRLR